MEKWIPRTLLLMEQKEKSTINPFQWTLSAVLPHLSKAPIEKVTLGFRPLPKDSHPIVGFPAGHPDIYITVMHSGITLGPLIGRLAATEILDGVRVDPLAPYRLERFKS